MCQGKDVLKLAAVAATVYTGGAAAGLWGAAEGAGAAGAGWLSAEGGAGYAGGMAADAAATGAAAGSGAVASGSSIMGGLKTAAQLAPLASLAAMGMQPQAAPQGIASPSAPPASQAAQTPAPNLFKKKLGALGDPTQTSGVGGVSDISLGRATILGQ